MLMTVQDTRSAIMLHGGNTVFKFKFNSSNNLKDSRVSRYRSALRQKMFELSGLEIVCDFSKLCAMSIDKDVMFPLHTSHTLIGAGWFCRPFSFSAALRSDFCLKNQRIFL